jgi:tetratricopeptide (TPR) repeat protein
MTKNGDFNLDQSAVIVHDTEHTTHHIHIRYKKRIIASALAFVVIVIAVCLVYRQTQMVTISDLDSIQSKADSVAQTKGIQAALAVYNRKIPKAANNDVRSQLDVQAGAIALNAHDYSTALNYAMQANSFDSTSESSALIAAVYQQQGNISQAVIYYDKAASEVKGPLRPGGSTASYYLQEAQDAEGAAGAQ